MVDYIQKRCPNCGEETDGGYCNLQCEEAHYQRYQELQLEIIPVMPSKKKEIRLPLFKYLN